MLVLALLFGDDDVGSILNNVTGTGTTSSSVSNTPYQGSAEEEELAQFVSVVLADTEDVWTRIFAEQGLTYEDSKLVLYTIIGSIIDLLIKRRLRHKR